MADLLLLLVIIGSFALLALLVRACDHVIGPDPADLDAGPDPGAVTRRATAAAARSEVEEVPA